MTDLTNRLQKRHKHLKKWAKNKTLSCYRLYERDLPDYPLIIDWLDGDVVTWIYDRTRDDTPEKKALFITTCKSSILEAFNIDTSKLHIKHRGKQKGLESQYTKLAKTSQTKIITENGLKFELNLSDYLDTGLFLDHRHTRKLCRDLSKGKRVLNLFAYTGSFTCYAIGGGATATTTVDLNKNYIEWAKQNVALNDFQNQQTNTFIVADCLEFLKKDKGIYDVIICDPPTFSNSKKMTQTFNIDDHYPTLIRDCLNRLSPSGTIIFSTNSRSFSLDPSKLPENTTITNISSHTIPEDFRNKHIHQCWKLTSIHP